MHIEYFNSGTKNSSLLRLLSDKYEEIIQLQAIILNFSRYESTEINNPESPGCESNAMLVFRRSESYSKIDSLKYTKNLVVIVSSDVWPILTAQIKSFFPEQNDSILLYESNCLYLQFITDGYW